LRLAARERAGPGRLPSAMDFSISKAEYLSVLQWHSIKEQASGMTKYFI
jgi:hypothetical protein